MQGLALSMTTKGVFGQPGYDIKRMSKTLNVERDSERGGNMHVDPFGGNLDRGDVVTRNASDDKSQK